MDNNLSQIGNLRNRIDNLRNQIGSLHNRIGSLRNQICSPERQIDSPRSLNGSRRNLIGNLRIVTHHSCLGKGPVFCKTERILIVRIFVVFSSKMDYSTNAVYRYLLKMFEVIIL